MCKPKIVLIGGGSYSWTHNIITDIALTACLHGSHIVLNDIDPRSLEVVGPLCRKISEATGAGLNIETSTDLRASLPGADFVVLTISTGGRLADDMDIDIPLRQGVS